ncbi:hypothetical protein BJV82DRAFT_340538 [Fennellomyces sp. T-0311]|nr:hypothetical protein BJV82DRAFT_340538 [Fennellomyces sp. T-0311]
MASQTIDQELNAKILAQIYWRHGILPFGDIANDPGFILVTQSDWTAKLVTSGVIWNLYDDSTLRALSNCQLIFHRPERLEEKTLHLLHFDTVAWFRVREVRRPTGKLQKALDDALQHWPNNKLQAWQELCEVWKKFGFLWPQKIMLGHRRHVKCVYNVTTDRSQHRYLQAHANDEASVQMSRELANRHAEGHQAWDIIKRSDLCPLHDFLLKEQRDIIVELIALFVHRIPMHYPIKLRSLCTSGYLCWRQHAEKGNKTSATTRLATLPVHSMRASRSSYLWRLEWTALNSSRQQRVEVHYEPSYVRCSSQVYLYPVAEMHRSPSAVTQLNQMALTRVGMPTIVSPPHKSQQKAEKFRGLELVDVADDYTAQHQWTFEMQGLGLEQDDDFSTDMGRNVDIEIGRRKPVVHGDIIALRQVHYLCSSPKSDVPISTWRPTPPLPPSIVSSMLPGTDVSPLSNSSTTVPSDVSSPPQSSTANTSASTNPGSPSKFAFLPHFATSHTPPQDHMHSVVTKEVSKVQSRTGEQLWIVEIASREDLAYHHAYASAAPATETSPIISPLSSSNNILRKKKGMQDLQSAGDNSSLRKNKSSDDFHPSREQSERDALQHIKAMISAESLPTEHSPSSMRRVQSLHDFGGYTLERQVTMDDAETPGALSFQPLSSNTQESSPRQHNADDLDVCASARAEHFIRLYANRKNRKTWSHLIRAGTFSGFNSGR